MDSMNIYAKPGEKLVFTGKNGSDFDQEQANQVLEIGKTYTLSYIAIGSWKSEVFLEEISGSFNSVMFLEKDQWDKLKNS